MSANMDTTGTFEIAQVLSQYQCYTAMHKKYTVQEWLAFCKEHTECLEYVAISAGVSEQEFLVVKTVLDAFPQLKIICLDVANGYSQPFLETIRKYRASFPAHVILAGNVCTGEMTVELLTAGADIIKIGIGPGSVCTTRIQTGVGAPQLSAVIECATAAHSVGGYVISDGGCSAPGDVSKALGAGADFVMLGGMFAGHDESGGELITINGQQYKQFYGMSSATAMKKYSGGVTEYRSSEGKTVQLPYRGPIEPTLLNILGGVRSTCTYLGVNSLEELHLNTTFIKVNRQVNQSLSHLKTDTDHGYSRFDSSSGKQQKAPSKAQANYAVPTNLNAVDVSYQDFQSKKLFYIPKKHIDAIDSIVLPGGAIENRVQQLASLIHQDYQGQTLNVFVVMTGAYRFAKDLVKFLKQFNQESEKKVNLKPYFFKIDKNNDPEIFEDPIIKVSFEDQDVRDQNVLIVKDIYDSGVYMQAIGEKVRAFNPNKLSFAIAFHKKNPMNQKYNFYGEYTGFLIPDQFVIGYGVGTQEDFNDLQHLCVINQNGLDQLRQ